jgi:integrase
MVGNKLNFTKGNIDALPLPESKHVIYHDTRVPGLIIRVFATGVKSFSLYRRIAGKTENITIGKYSKMSPEQARKEAEKLNGKIAEGMNPAEEKRSLRAELTLGDLFDYYLVNHAKIHKRTWKYDQNMFRLYFSHWRKRRISTLARREVQNLHGKMGNENGEAQANRAFALLNTIFEKGKEWGYTGENPCLKLNKFRLHSRERFLQESEFPSFFKAVMNELSETERDFFLLLLFTGARKSNVLSMAWKDINFDLRVWNIPASQSKNKTSYSVPLVKPALEIINRRCNADQESPWIFSSKASKSGHLEEPKRAWTRVRKISELEDVRMHDLRRTLGSWMAMTGASLLTISYALGHKLASLSVTAVYARASVEPIRLAMETAVQAMLRKGGMKVEVENIIEYRKSV